MTGEDVSWNVLVDADDDDDEVAAVTPTPWKTKLHIHIATTTCRTDRKLGPRKAVIVVVKATCS